MSPGVVVALVAVVGLLLFWALLVAFSPRARTRRRRLRHLRRKYPHAHERDLHRMAR